jgi:hypothetical protein
MRIGEVLCTEEMVDAGVEAVVASPYSPSFMDPHITAEFLTDDEVRSMVRGILVAGLSTWGRIEL